MDIIQRKEIKVEKLQGRALQKAVGRDSSSPSSKMTVTFATYSKENGLMEPHQHAEETVYIIDAKDGWVRRGPSRECLNEKFMLKQGAVLHFEEWEWHVFECKDDGFIDALCIYGQVDNIRPEKA